MARVEADLAPELRESVAFAFRKRCTTPLSGAVNSIRTARCASPTCVRAACSCIALLTLVRDSSFKGLRHVAVGHPEGSPRDHMSSQEEMGLRPAALGS